MSSSITVERCKVCRYNAFRWCIHPKSASCSIVSMDGTVSVCVLRRGGDFHAPRLRASDDSEASV